jgi:flagellar assembly protein FliH
VADASVKVVHDPAIEIGGCVVEAGPCRIDAQVGPAMERARALIDSVGQGSRGSA